MPAFYGDKVRAMFHELQLTPGERYSSPQIREMLKLPKLRAYSLAIGEVLRERGAWSIKSNGVRYYVIPK
jgi:hypothetical protein